MLARDVASLAQVVRDQGNNIEKQIKELAIGVTQAAAPRRTDWQMLISLALLILALGSAVFWPLNQTAKENQQALVHVEQSLDAHSREYSHPVGSALINRLESELANHIAANNKETEMQNATWDRNMDLISQRIESRLNKLESYDAERNKADLDELRALKYRSYLYHMGPCPQLGNGTLDGKSPK